MTVRVRDHRLSFIRIFELALFAGDFQLHLQTVQAMLPYYPASGHNNYTKSIFVYLQDMQILKETNPDVYTFFEDGNFITRRSDRYWSGLPDDLVIEQVRASLRRISTAKSELKIENINCL